VLRLCPPRQQEIAKHNVAKDQTRSLVSYATSRAFGLRRELAPLLRHLRSAFISHVLAPRSLSSTRHPIPAMAQMRPAIWCAANSTKLVATRAAYRGSAPGTTRHSSVPSRTSAARSCGQAKRQQRLNGQRHRCHCAAAASAMRERASCRRGPEPLRRAARAAGGS
jgi:hypothetical protein